VKRPGARVLLPAAVIAAAIAGAVVMVAARPEVETQRPDVALPLVRVVDAVPQDFTVIVRAQGSVVPRTESSLVPEVSGRVVWVSPALAAGGFFEQGEALLRVDRVDYEVRLRRAEATVQGLESQLRLARRNLERARELKKSGVTSVVDQDDSENKERVAAAALAEAAAALEQARVDLERTEVRAPFAGRVREKHVDVGQFVERGTPVARIYAVDYAEVRLPVPDADVGFLGLPLDYRGEERQGDGPAVELRARFAGDEHLWQGRIVRTEGEIDPRTRMVHAVARVEDPYGRSAAGDRPPLAVGMFVDAEIGGRTVPGTIVVPRAALRDGNRVLVVDAEGRLRPRAVEVLRLDRDVVALRSGVAAGERVCVSPVEAFTDGMRVRTVEDGA
jgi:RND family efflux transporter MFP subunit